VVGRDSATLEKNQICNQNEDDDIQVLGNATSVGIGVHDVAVP